MYTITEDELFSIDETLKYSITILLGQQIKIYTDIKNITRNFFLIQIDYSYGDS